MFATKITGMANALPERAISNEELVVRYKDRVKGGEFESFLAMSGIRERRAVSPGQTASDIAVVGAERLLTNMPGVRERVDTLIYCSLTEDYRTPATACVVQDRLRLPKTTCTFDMVQACPAFTHLLAVVNGLVASGTSKCVLAILSDSLTQLIHPMDRGLVPIHGDGAAALLFESAAAPAMSATSATQFDWFAFGTDGAQAERIIVPDGMGRHPATADSLRETTDETGNTRTPLNLRMDGAAVFHFAIHTVPPFLKETCAAHGMSLDDYDLVLFHQANKLIVDILYNVLKIPASKRFFYLETVGNLSGVSLPFTLIEAYKANRIRPGARILLCGFGAGMSWGAVSLRWQNDAIVVPETAVLPK